MNYNNILYYCFLIYLLQEHCYAQYSPKRLQNNVRKTVPLSDNKLFSLIENLKIDEGNQTCLRSSECVKEWIKNLNKALRYFVEKQSLLTYQFETNITEINTIKLSNFSSNLAYEFDKAVIWTARKFLKVNEKLSKRSRKILKFVSTKITFKPDDIKKLVEFQTKLDMIYAEAFVCRPDSSNNVKCLSLNPELENIMKASRDYDELLWAWKSWRDVTGPNMRDIYTQSVDFYNKVAKENGYRDLSEIWILQDFQDKNFEKKFDRLFQELQPLYIELHEYVRRKLQLRYGDKYPKNHNPNLIPAHLLGNMWSQTWGNIFDIVIPYPKQPILNFTQALTDRKYTPKKIFKDAENFFTSLGFEKMTPAFWKYSIFEKPTDRPARCFPTSYDFFNGFDYRINMCTNIIEEDYLTVHHQMGSIVYSMAYRNQPPIFRNGANAAFPGAIGDLISLSVQTPEYLKSKGLIENSQMNYKENINYLMKIALNKIAFIPFVYIIDKWRWDVFRGRINESNYNSEWWRMVEQYQGIESPILRTERDFDPGAKFHVAEFVPYARYLMEFILEFQFYESLCNKANHRGPLHTCSFYKSKEAGQLLKSVLELGTSKSSAYALRIITGQTEPSTSSLIKYFQPLYDWLVESNSNEK